MTDLHEAVTYTSDMSLIVVAVMAVGFVVALAPPRTISAVVRVGGIIILMVLGSLHSAGVVDASCGSGEVTGDAGDSAIIAGLAMVVPVGLVRYRPLSQSRS